MSTEPSGGTITQQERQQAHRNALAGALVAARERLDLLLATNADRAAIAAAKLHLRVVRDELHEAGRKTASPAAR